MTTATSNAAWPRRGRSNTRQIAGPERARYTVRWFQDGCRPQSTGEGQPDYSRGSRR
ncbi:MAG: hypothetical protein R3E46_18145 [Sedimenticolaceae bacterium]